MTGFARSEKNIPDGRLVWEIRSVNHRYLDTQFRLPEGFRALEPRLKKLATGYVSRGKIDAMLTVQYAPDHAPQITLNLPFATRLIHCAETLNRQMAESYPINPVDIMRWPGVIQESEGDTTALYSDVLTGFEEAMAELAGYREREGAQIRQMLQQRCDEVTHIVRAVQQRLPAVLDSIRERLTQRIRSVVKNTDQDRLEQELVLIAQKLDVSEELDRLNAHVAEVLDSLDGTGPTGRHLDFLMQEFNREANTLASKSADTGTTQHAIRLKVLVEQMREQIQNVE